MASIQSPAVQRGGQFTLWFEEISGFVRNLLASCALGAAGIFTLQHRPELLVSFGQWQPLVVGGMMAVGGFVLAILSWVRLLYGSLRLLPEGKRHWLEFLVLLVMSFITIEMVSFTYVALGMKSAR
jgi:hypothetical protein